MPPQRASEVSLRNTLADYKFFKVLQSSEDGISAFCLFCGKSFAVEKSNHVTDHVNGAIHERNVNLNKPQRTLIVTKSSGGPQKEDIFHRESVESWIDAGLPFKALGHSKLKQRNVHRTIPSPSNLSNNYATTVYNEKFQDLKELVTDYSAYYVVFDEADYQGTKYYAFLLGKLDNQKTHQPHLVEITNESCSPNSVLVVQKLMKILSKLQLLQQDTDYQRFCLLITDAASYCILASN